MEEALHDVPAFRDFAGLCHRGELFPVSEASFALGMCWMRHKLADQLLATVNALLQAKGRQFQARTVSDATQIAAPTATKKNKGEARDPGVDQSKKSKK